MISHLKIKEMFNLGIIILYFFSSYRILEKVSKNRFTLSSLFSACSFWEQDGLTHNSHVEQFSIFVIYCFYIKDNLVFPVTFMYPVEVFTFIFFMRTNLTIM